MPVVYVKDVEEKYKMVKRRKQKAYGIVIDYKLKELRNKDYLKFLKEVQNRVITKHQYENYSKKPKICKNQCHRT